MLTLTSASIVSRKFIRYAVISIIAIVIIRFTILSGINLYERFFPDPPPEATVKFGKLPALSLPNNAQSEEDVCRLVYNLETASGSLPVLYQQTNVYYMPKPISSIGALEKANTIARDLGFNSEGRELVETVFLFTKANSPSSLNINIVTRAFSISYDVNSDPQVFNQIPPQAENAVSAVKGLLGRAGLINDYKLGPTKTQLLRVESGKLVKAISQSEANIVKVNLYREKYGVTQFELPAVTPDPDESNVWFLMSNSSGNVQIIAGEYHYFPLDKNKFSTYPVKTAEQAFEDLKNCKGGIAKIGDNYDGEIKIRNVYLAYYDYGQYIEYYQPVVVFEGENDFVAYVPAVTDEFYGANQVDQTK
ncbi:hypothetical protein IPM62_05825 [Candidatus Woesebacteria bacterium]|nr:MAG: hypothetical protein IPM62_05825 [Candidatus Woesebacteria bacterium]